MLRCLFLYQGMVEPGDTVSATLKKEFGEEAMNSLEATPEEKRKIEEQINELFSHGERVSETYLKMLHIISSYMRNTFSN